MLIAIVHANGKGSAMQLDLIWFNLNWKNSREKNIQLQHMGCGK